MTNKICKISLFSAILACIANMPVSARVNVKSNSNRSYSDAYNQVMSQQQQQAYYDATATHVATASDTGSLPVAVDDKKLAEAILNNTSETIRKADLEACSMIYPNGVFRWGIPESGVRNNGQSQCVAVIELRDANSNAVLATTTVAAGDSMKCNVDMFPQHGLFPAISKVELPADNPPTMEDVEKVLNQEQKQGAGFKIAAAAIISGVAGNMLAPKQAGDSKLFGTSKTQLMDTAIGATAGAGIMAASTYSGKVAGDTIKSTAVNAASGMIVGNMAAGMAGGNTVLDIERCVVDGVEKDCIPGKLQEYGTEYAYKDGLEKVYFINAKGDFYACKPDGAGKYKDCSHATRLLAITFNGVNNTIEYYDSLSKGTTSSTSWGESNANKSSNTGQNMYLSISPNDQYTFEKENNYMKQGSAQDSYFLVRTGKESKSSQRAYAIFDNHIDRKAFGYTVGDFNVNKDGNFSNPVYYSRNADGTVGICLQKCPGQSSSSVQTTTTKTETTTTVTTTTTTQSGATTTTVATDNFQFTPMGKDASDGGLVDLSNEARAKATLVGTAAGGALGGFAGYQGAKSEIEQRWVDAVRVYNDSLSNFVCMTGGRFLAQYNDSFQITEMKKEE